MLKDHAGERAILVAGNLNMPPSSQLTSWAYWLVRRGSRLSHQPMGLTARVADITGKFGKYPLSLMGSDTAWSVAIAPLLKVDRHTTSPPDVNYAVA
jgi:hypothetical protein